MFTRVGRWLVVLALVISTGSHWFALQSVAWVKMAVNFAQTEPLDVALTKTFDGKHPCGLCKTVQEGRKAEQKQTIFKAETKLEFLTAAKAVTLPLPPQSKHLTAFQAAVPLRFQVPPTPPPRAA